MWRGRRSGKGKEMDRDDDDDEDEVHCKPTDVVDYGSEGAGSPRGRE